MNNQEILNSLNEKIKAAEEALLYLNQTKAGLERVIANSAKTPVEEAYKKVYGVYPIDSIDKTWDPFQAGYNAAYKEPEDTVWKSVALRFGEKLSDIGPCGYYEFSPDEWFEWVVNTYEKLADDWLILLNKEKQVKKLQEKKWTYKITDEHGESNPYKQGLNMIKEDKETEELMTSKGYEKNSAGVWEPKPQEPEEVEEGLKEAFRESVKQGVVSSSTKPQTLYSLIGEFLNEIDYMYNTDSEREYFLEKFEEWLPKPIEETCGLSENDADWNRGYNTYREYLMMQLK